jgi:hypothetical protein
LGLLRHQENHVEEEHVDCETGPSLEPSDSQSVTHVFEDEELPFKKSFFENVSF